MNQEQTPYEQLKGLISDEERQEHIEMCVNSHDELVEALKDIVSDHKDKRITQASINKAVRILEKVGILCE